MKVGPRTRILVFAILLLQVGYANAQMPWPGEPAPPCMVEFTKLREEAEKKGMATKAAAARHVARDEMCTYVTVYTVAEARWVKFAEAGVQSCGIPIQVANQLKQMHANTEQTREKICTWSPRTHPLVGDFNLPQPPAIRSWGY
jgi:hypothetical protein